jgi:hypothetical protein
MYSLKIGALKLQHTTRLNPESQITYQKQAVKIEEEEEE